MPRLTLEILNEELLRKSIDTELFERGRELFLAGKASLLELNAGNARCAVQGRHPHKVDLQVGDKFLFLKCDCTYAERGLVCEHDVAAFLAVRHHFVQNQPARWREQIGNVVSATQAGGRRNKPTSYFLFYSLQEAFTTTATSFKLVPFILPFGSLPIEMKQVEDPAAPEFIARLIEAIFEYSLPLRTPHNSLNPTGCINCPPESVLLANILVERSRSYSYYSINPPQPEYLTILERTESPVFFGIQHEPLHQRLSILPGIGKLKLRLDRTSEGLQLIARVTIGETEISLNQAPPFDAFVLWYSPLWVVIDTNIIQMDPNIPADAFNRLLESPEIKIPAKDERDFLKRYLLELAESVPLEGNAITWETVDVPAIPRVYLTETDGEIEAELRFGYGEYEVLYDPKLPEASLKYKADHTTIIRLLRKPEIEAERFGTATSSHYGLKRSAANRRPATLLLRARQHPVDFLLHKIPNLARDGFDIYGEDKLKTARVNRNTPHINFKVSSGIDWFDLQAIIAYGDVEVPLKDIQTALRKRERYIKLADGTIGEIPEDWFDRYKHLFALGETVDGQLRLSRYHISFLDQMLTEVDQLQTDTGFEEARHRLRQLTENDFAGITTYDLPGGFLGELRPYQKAGFDWLHFLRDFDFGGCLADDMGLGKTIQALVFLQAIYEPRPGYEPPAKASLLIVPRSLLVNWQRESTRFTPRLQVLEYFESDRIKDISAFSQADLVITSYGVMLRDILLLRQYEFHYVILDESQSIKNPLSQTAKAARLLRGTHRLVMTGTPIENSTVELWSQFAFLNPGLLGSLDYFRQEFGAPIESKKDEDTARLLRKMVYPFILRRTKDQVAPELPPRSERILYADMEPAQQKVYRRMRDYYRGMLLGMSEEESLGQNRMKILEGLLRLRQISNHPLLVDDKYRGESGKFELLLETLETLVAEGHKALVFSQFVQMLRLVRMELDDRQIPYAYLDGHTQDRQAQVDLFQANPHLPFFLISLKAGGVGLNLTAADYVIHIDPWWNPAVETQASDRTHRIGQDKPVFVYKLITRDTVEEKILVLQQQKKDLVDQIITTDSSFFKSLTRKDLETLFGA
jgi:non-specific serine/threonine protein kinase